MRSVPSHNQKGIKRFRWAPFYAILLTLYTAFTLLMTFVIPQNVVAVDDNDIGSDTETATSSGDIPVATDVGYNNGEITVTENSYTSDNISIEISDYYEYDTAIHVADVTLRNGTALSSGLAEGSFGRNLGQKTSEIAEDVGAILAINGDYYGFRDEGYVMRNGYLYRDEPAGYEDLVVYEDGSFDIVSEDEVTAEDLAAAGATQIYSFGPGLVIDGEIAVDVDEEINGKSMNSNPRTAIGIIDDDHYIFIVSDGRNDESAGLDLYELAEFMQKLGCKQAYNLDGGGSSSMWFNGELINNPTGGRAGHGNSERSVSDIIYVADQEA